MRSVEIFPVLVNKARVTPSDIQHSAAHSDLRVLQASGGLNFNEEADEDVEETQEFRPMSRDRATTKKKAASSSRGDLLHLLIW
ncbi:hypothetical protein Tco_1041735 [Tanacetum coccineum]|uniref:Uncharacterized protein n=1 Tax=Tanacetum coccineum TaxID=301880 RepID=A0ABQ5GHK7_9ASTR